MTIPEPRKNLIKRIKDRRQSIKWYIDSLEPTGNRLTNFNIICGAIVTALTATSALGGKPLMDALGITDPNSLTWRILFAIAALFSLMSTIAANLYKTHDIASRLSKAQVCAAKLEGLETSLELDQITLKDAATQYAQYIAEVPFITGSKFRMFPSAIDWVKGGINEPKPNQVVDSTIFCSGWVEDLDPDCHLWLAVEAGGHIWPKEREFLAEADGSWKNTVYEEGTRKTFALSLFVANKQANRKFRAWLDAGDKSGRYKEMQRVPGTRRLAKIDGLHRGSVS